MTANQRKLCITVGGGLGDQVCAEPVLRYMKEKWFRDDDIAVMTQYPPLFSHLPVIAYDQPVQFPEARSTVSTHPQSSPARDPYDQIACFHRVHPLDYIALRLLRRTLPLAHKQIKLVPGASAEQRAKTLLEDLAGPEFKSRVVLLHPGRAWQAKTLPSGVWQCYIDQLTQASFLPVLIGQDFVSAQGEERGTVGDLDGAALDLRNRLSLQESMAVIALAPALITNDSGPLHIAGAFENWIGVIATVKDPSYILPFRRGSQAFRARALERYKAYEVDFDFDPLVYLDVPLNFLPPEKLAAAAPEPEMLVEFTRQAVRDLAGEKHSSEARA